MFRIATDPEFTPVQQAVIDRIDAAVGMGVLGLALLVLLAGIRTVKAMS